jgi:hypothetical protein
MLSEVLSTSGIAAIPNVWDPESVVALNAALDEPFRIRSMQRRAYVGADELVSLDVLEHVFPRPLRALLPSVMDDPVLYHCHAYEISGDETRPHIHSALLSGWHRDTETVEAHDRDAARYVSVFLYLTDVGPENGPFELLPRDPEHGFVPGSPCVSVVGPAGSAFAWNRSYYHRAAPNRSATRRRLLKLSVQLRTLPNDRIGHGELARAAADPRVDALGLGALFGADRPTTIDDDAAAPSIVELPAAGEVVVSRAAVAAHRLVGLARPSVR